MGMSHPRCSLSPGKLLQTTSSWRCWHGSGQSPVCPPGSAQRHPGVSPGRPAEDTSSCKGEDLTSLVFPEPFGDYFGKPNNHGTQTGGALLAQGGEEELFSAIHVAAPLPSQGHPWPLLLAPLAPAWPCSSLPVSM